MRVGDDALVPLAAAGDFANIVPDEPAAHGWMVVVQADGPGNATLVRLMGVESDRSVLRAANPGFPDIALTRAGETIDACRGCVRRARGPRRNAPSLPAGGRKRPIAPPAVCRPVGESGSDGRREALRGKGC